MRGGKVIPLAFGGQKPPVGLFDLSLRLSPPQAHSPPPTPTDHHDPIERIRSKIPPPFSPLVPLFPKLIIREKPSHPQNLDPFRLLPKDPLPIDLLRPKPPKVLAYLHIAPSQNDKMDLPPLRHSPLEYLIVSSPLYPRTRHLAQIFITTLPPTL